MQTYEMTCTCGHVMRVEASNAAEAIDKMKEKMDKEAIKDHWDDMHVGDPRPGVKEVHLMIEKELVPAAARA